MKIDRPQAAVPWVPARYRYALFRLAAYARLAKTPSCEIDQTRVLAIDRDQNNAEAYTLAIVAWATASAFLAQLLSRWLVLGLAILAAIPLALFAFSAAVVIIGAIITPLLHAVGLPRGPNNHGVTSAIVFIVLTLAASYFATLDGWVAVVAWFFLGVIILNGTAAAILFGLRQRVRQAELRCVG